MTDKDKIKAEVDRLLKKEWNLHSSTEAKYRCEVYRELLEFIDSLPEEPVSEGLKEEVNKYCNQILIGDNDTFTKSNVVALVDYIARHFVNWQKKQLLDKACEWLEDHADEYADPYGPGYSNDALVKDFRKAMEEWK